MREAMRDYHFMHHSVLCKRDEMNWPFAFVRFRVAGVLVGLLKGLLRR